MKDNKHSTTCHLTTAATDKTIIPKLMLRFRPIAPKPPTAASSTVTPPPEKINGRKTRGRPKRKYAQTKNDSKIGDRIHPTAMTTLQLLPEVPVRSKSELSDNSDPTVTESSVTIESVTDVTTAFGRLGGTDDGIMKNLELDTCPGFVSDGRNMVRWTNPAFRKMTRVQEGRKVSLVVKCELPVEYLAFSCRVRVKCATWRKEKGPSCQVVPCDVWRMDFGGLAWRLDLNAALTLGGNFMEFNL